MLAAIRRSVSSCAGSRDWRAEPRSHVMMKRVHTRTLAFRRCESRYASKFSVTLNFHRNRSLDWKCSWILIACPSHVPRSLLGPHCVTLCSPSDNPHALSLTSTVLTCCVHLKVCSTSAASSMHYAHASKPRWCCRSCKLMQVPSVESGFSLQETHLRAESAAAYYPRLSRWLHGEGTTTRR